MRNLLTIYQAFTEWPDEQLRAYFTGMRYGDLKKQVAEAVVTLSRAPSSSATSRKSRLSLATSRRSWRKGAARRVSPLAKDTVTKVKQAMGLFTPPAPLRM